MATYSQYNHHGTEVWAEDTLKGKHRSHCLCFNCDNFNPTTGSKCPIAAELYQFSVRHNTVNPVYECPIFKEKT